MAPLFMFHVELLKSCFLCTYSHVAQSVAIFPYLSVEKYFFENFLNLLGKFSLPDTMHCSTYLDFMSHIYCDMYRLNNFARLFFFFYYHYPYYLCQPSTVLPDHIHLYVWMYVCMYGCMDVCMYVWMYGCVDVCIYLMKLQKIHKFMELI